MAYMMPLRFIKVSNKRSDKKQYDVAICATRIVALMSTDFYQARRTLKDEKDAKTLINACGTQAAKTAIFLDNGSVVASPLTIQVLMNAIEKANRAARAKETVKMKVYDVVDEEPPDNMDELVDEIASSFNENTEEDILEFE